MLKKWRGGIFFLIGGLQPNTVVLEGDKRLCPSCGLNSCQQERQDYYLSLFFIPLFPVKRGEPYWRCGRCGQPCQAKVMRPEPPPRPEPAPWPNESSSAPAGACRFCGGELKQDFKYCPYCGARISN